MSATTANPWTGLTGLQDIAATQLGVAEAPRGSNEGAAVQRYQATTSLDGTGWPWCAAFVDWCVARLLENEGSAGFDRPRTAAAFGLIAWAKDQAKNGVHVFAPFSGTSPRPGDIVVYDFSHCGIVHSIKTPTLFVAVEGNTNEDGGREGYEVASRQRSCGAVRAFIRLPQSSGGNASAAAKPTAIAGKVAALIALLALLMLGVTACTEVADSQLQNGCVIVAFNRETVMDAHYALDPTFWRRVIIVQYKDRPQLGHAYLYYEADGQGFAYDEGGTRYMKTASHSAYVVGWQLAGDNLLSAQWVIPADLETAAKIPAATPAP